MKKQPDEPSAKEREGNETLPVEPNDSEELSDADLEGVSGGGDGTGTGVTWNP
jgi:hypothetical protein